MRRLNLHQHANLLTGFFVVSAVVIFMTAFFVVVQKKGLFRLKYTLYVVFDSGIGLRQGTDVQFNGVKIGRVEDVSLLSKAARGRPSGSVVLRLSVDRRFQDFITASSMALAQRDKNLVSDRVVNIETPSTGGKILIHGDTLRLSDSRDIETLISGLTRLMGRMDQLIGHIGSVVAKTQDPNTSVGAMLGSRELYDRLLEGIENVDATAGAGKELLGRVNRAGDSLNTVFGELLVRADSTSVRMLGAAEQAEALGFQANSMARQGEILLGRLDVILQEGTGKIEQAGDLMNAVGDLWFIRSKLKREDDFPMLRRSAGP
jgi:phospholipid/cholesterol/gamma-HCH transport system substrate-binding protein